MKIKMYVFLIIAFLLPSISTGEVIQLKDGSIILGRFIRMENDSIYVLTSFGARLVISKRLVKEISFIDSIEVNEKKGENLFGSAAPGSLHVMLGDIKLSSKISVHRGRKRSEAEKANSIEQALYVDNTKVFSFIDSSMDKIIWSGPDQIIKNNIVLRDIKICVASGPRKCKLVVRNISGKPYEKQFEPEPIYEEVDIGNVLVYPGMVSQIKIVKKRTKFGFGGLDLKLKK